MDTKKAQTIKMTDREKQIILRDTIKHLMHSKDISALKAYEIISAQTGLGIEEIKVLTEYR